MMKTNFGLGIVRMTQLLVAGLIIGSPTDAAVRKHFEIGVDRSNLSDQSAEVREKSIEGIRATGAQWFRDGFPGHVNSRLNNFVDELSQAKKAGLKVLVILGPKGNDYDQPYKNENAGDDFCKRCGWPQGSARYSLVNLHKVETNLCDAFDAFKAAGLDIDAFEIGNEVTWICFNGDMPNGHVASPHERMVALRGYAQYLKTAAKLIKNPKYFPHAKIITFGMNHPGDPRYGITDAAQFVADLKNLDGYNYLDNKDYHVDGYGMHLYPPGTNVAGTVQSTFEHDAKILADKPIWITEWGVSRQSFPNKKLRTRTDGINEFFGTLDGLNNVVLGPVFWYSYNINGKPGGTELVDLAGNLLPDANILTQRARFAESKQEEVVFSRESASLDSMNSPGQWHEFCHSPHGLLQKNRTYKISFNYKILKQGKDGSFYAFLRSASDPQKSTKWKTWDNRAATTGRINFAVNTEDVDDYYLVIGGENHGAIELRDISLKSVR
ncbi:MAG: glycosyl hydrolase [Candidatus Obscuribacterales bacterium]|nr:glycosyl hydrolase [Candidatus Obscuribacterales bacterium]